MKIGAIQFNPAFGDLTGNIEKLKRLIRSTIDTALIVIPELANSGYSFKSRKEAMEFSEPVNDSRFVEFIIAEAKANNKYIVSGFNERFGDNLFNSSLLAGPNGLVGIYRKIHLFMNEKDIFEPGDSEPQVYDIGVCMTGMLICFDWMFPELWRILGMKKADVICHPSNLVLPYAQQAVPVHGMINRTFVITANRTGTERDLTFTGQSFIADPTGKTLSMASKDRDEVIEAEADLHLSRNKMITSRNHAFLDRKPELYSKLIRN